VSILRPDPGRGSPAAFVYVSDLNSPQGLAFNTIYRVTSLYIGEENQIARYVHNAGDTAAPATREVLVTNLMGMDARPYRSIAIGPDQSVCFSYGSNGNYNAADVTAVPELAAVNRMDPDGSGLQMVASGLRNPEGLAILPGTGMIRAPA
jgi:glucose/arabinose dehydrogenase